MVKLSRRSEKIRKFILTNVERHPQGIVRVASKKFGVTRQAINKHVKSLIEQGSIESKGATKNKSYSLRANSRRQFKYAIDGSLQEDVVWRKDVLPLLNNLPDNVENVWGYCFTEIFNNAIDHSEGVEIIVVVERNAITTKIQIFDDGEGIFKKIQRELGLLDERHALLELSKGKVTTDPQNHTGEGIYFSSRMMEQFAILSGATFFSHDDRSDLDWLIEGESESGTAVFMKMKNDTARTTQKVFDQFANPESDDYGFAKTVVPVRLAQYKNEMLVSRSQAKRLLARVDRFRVVILDFEGVSAIGQAFADEIFRVFANKKTTTRIVPINMNGPVQRMVVRAL